MVKACLPGLFPQKTTLLGECKGGVMLALPADVKGKAFSPKCRYSGKSGEAPHEAGQSIIQPL